MEGDGDEDAGDDEVESEDGVLAVENCSDGEDVKQTSNGFVVKSTKKFWIRGCLYREV